MSRPEIIEELGDRITRLLPGAERLREDLRRNIEALLQSALARMDLVTREEFEVQKAVLARTREKLEALEQRIEALEQAAPPPPEQSPPGD
ncbi:MAG: accessory factor UbiK family protein [Gammaproteobacteria bacterium]|nr:MAG: accessory factor UbiK family protein [Gammaproteobacteria bacterium]